MLSHRADVIIFGNVVVEVVVMESVGLITRPLFNVETVVFDVGVHACLVHESVVFFGAIAGVGNGG